MTRDTGTKCVMFLFGMSMRSKKKGLIYIVEVGKIWNGIIGANEW